MKTRVATLVVCNLMLAVSAILFTLSRQARAPVAPAPKPVDKSVLKSPQPVVRKEKPQRINAELRDAFERYRILPPGKLGITEPLEFLDYTILADGGTQTVRFRDANGAEVDITLPNPLAGKAREHGYIVSVTATQNNPAKRTGELPVHGPEDAALCGILSRWAAGEPTFWLLLGSDVEALGMFHVHYFGRLAHKYKRVTDRERMRYNALDFVLNMLRPMLRTVDLKGAQNADARLAKLKRLTEISSLDLENSNVTDAGLAHLERMTRLQLLYLAGTKVTDAALVHLKDLTGLREIDLGRTQVNGSGLKYLKRLRRLEALTVTSTGMNDAALAHLQGRTNLTHLWIGNTKVTDAGLAHLKGLTSLRGLVLDNDAVTDAGLVHLQGLTKLEFLSLNNTRITDAGLVHLKGLTKLQYLHLKKTRVSAAEVQRLHAALRKCEIIR